MNTSTLISMITFLGASSVFASGESNVGNKSGTILDADKSGTTTKKDVTRFVKDYTLDEEDALFIKTLDSNQAPHMALRALYATVFLAIGGAGGYFFAKRQSEKSFD